MIASGWTDWEYNGDIGLSYGGVFFRHYMRNGFPDYTSAIRVTDLESATGAEGLTLVEFITTFNHGNKEWIESALGCIGYKIADLRKMGKKAIIDLITEAYLAYGYYDPDYEYYRRPNHFVLVNGNYGPGSDKARWDGWEPCEFGKGETVALHKRYNGDLEAYIKDQWLQ